MTFSLPSLPYNKNALAPYISEETLDFHHGKHHNAYVTNLNKLLEGKENKKSLEEIILSENGAIFNNAAQVWNHSFYWSSMGKNCGKEPHGKIADLIVESFGAFEQFKEQFSKVAIGHFGSGWAWLVQDQSSGRLLVESTANAGCPLTEKVKPILTCDVWEHAYYIDYRNARAKYVENFWHLVNWEFANQNLL